MQAIFLRLEGETVIFQTTDARTIPYPYKRLSDGSKQKLQALILKSEERLGSVKRVKIVTRGELYEPRFGSYLDNHDSEARIFHKYLPVGSWVEIEGDVGKAFFQYQGEETIGVVEKGGCLWLKRGEGPVKIFAVTSDIELPPGQLDDHLCVINKNNNLKGLFKKLPKTQQLLISTRERMGEELLAQLSGQRIIGFSGQVELSNLDKFRELDLLFLDYYGNVNSRCLPLELSFPRLTQLTFWNYSNIDWQVGTRNLKDLLFLITKRGTYKVNNRDLASFSTKINLDFSENRKLRAVCVADSKQLIGAGVESGSGLRYLRISNQSDLYRSDDFDLLKGLKELEYLDIADYRLDRESLDDWFGSGNLKGLKVYQGRYVPTSSDCPVLKRFTGSLVDAEVGDLERLPESICDLTLYAVSDEHIESAERFSGLKRLDLGGGELSSLSLENWPQLEFLKLRGYTLDELDLSVSPELESVTLRKCDLRLLSGLDGHMALSDLVVMGGSLLAIEPVLSKSRLNYLYLSSVSKLSDLDSLGRVNSIDHLDLRFCDDLSSIEPMFSISRPDRVNISSCDKLPISE